MGLHPSLKIDKAGVQQRSVLTRLERIKEIMRKGSWSDTSSVTALPKTKVIRIKAKKKVKEEVPGAGGTAAAPAAAAGKPAVAAPAAKPAAGADKKK